MSKNSKQKLGAYISILYMLTKSFSKNRQLMCRVWKRQNSVLKNVFHKTTFRLFCTNHKKCRFSPKLDVHTYNVEMYATNFCLKFFHTLKYFFACRSVRSREHQRISDIWLVFQNSVLTEIISSKETGKAKIQNAIFLNRKKRWSIFYEVFSSKISLGRYEKRD